jgi:hypothetical protein
MIPFHLKFTLSRRQRLVLDLPPWLPAVAATLGFSLGAAYAGIYASPWFLLLLLLPVLVYHGLFVFAFDIIVNGGRAVEIHADDFDMQVTSDGETKWLSLDGIFQVFRSDDTWTVLHLDGTVITIPETAITMEQIGYLRIFAHRTLAARAEPQS